MVNHTMLVSFSQPFPDAELDRYLADIERALRATGLVQSFAAARHIPVPREEAIPALIATVIVQIAVADREALAEAFAAPGLGEVIEHWQARHPYRVGWATTSRWRRKRRSPVDGISCRRHNGCYVYN